MSLQNRRFRGKVVYTDGGIVGIRDSFRSKVDTGDPNAAPTGGGGGAAGLQWDYSDLHTARPNVRIWLNNSQTAKWEIDGLTDIYLGNAIGAESITYSATGLPSGLSINSSTGQLTGSSNPVGYNQVTVTASDGTNEITKTVYVLQRSQQAYTTAGTYSFVVPDFVDEIGAVCVGPGGQGYTAAPTVPGPFSATAGGGGGGLRWIRNMPVSSGETLTVTIPSSPSKSWVGPTTNWNFVQGSPVTISRGPSVLLEGGAGWRNQLNGTSYPTAAGYGTGTPVGVKPYGGFVGGGNGGFGHSGPGTGGGGGAGGYDGNGGYGTPAGAGKASFADTASGGGCGGGGPAPTATAGGGVGLLGRGDSGFANGPSGANTFSGEGGSGGARGEFNFPAGPGKGGDYGGGGASYSSFTAPAAPVGNGGKGAVRIIWGSDRYYPAHNTGDK